MLTQQIIAIGIITFIILRLWTQKRNQKISINEFSLWLSFWMLAIGAIIFIKKIDAFVQSLGFSSSGLNVLEHSAIIVILYLIFKLRIRIRKIENDITTIVRHSSLEQENENRNNK